VGTRATARPSPRLAIAAVVGALVFLATPGRATACSVTDVACTSSGVANEPAAPVDSIVGIGSKTVDTVTDAARRAGGADSTGVVDDAASTVASNVEHVRDAVADAVTKTGDPVAPVVDGIVDTARDAVGKGTPADAARTTGHSTGAPNRTRDDDARGGHPSSSTRSPIPEFGFRRSVGQLPTALGAVGSGPGESTVVPIALARRGLLPALLGSSAARIAAEVAKRIAFPLALLLIVIGFLFVQHRIDRREPKLASAPVVSDIARFA
jgi:hypothetical protein